MVVVLALVGAAVGLAAFVGTRSGRPAPTLAFKPCIAGDVSAGECGTLTVPLDRVGEAPDTVTLFVERRVVPHARGVMVLLPGGPGQTSDAFRLLWDRNPWSLTFDSLGVNYDLVTFDLRGTGQSGPLGCDNLGADRPTVAAVAACARVLGPSRRFYTTFDHVEDIESVRKTLGVDKLALLGVSYGTRLALAYARAHPDRVERLLLDSVSPFPVDPFALSTLRAIPRVLAAACGRSGCADASPDPAGEVVALANRLAASPIRGRVPREYRPGSNPDQRPGRRVTISGGDLIGLVIGADRNLPLLAALPGAIHDALTGDPRSLLRLKSLDRGPFSGLPSSSLNRALFYATACGDGPLPWHADDSLKTRKKLVAEAAGSIPSSALGGFGRWAAARVGGCLGWPESRPPVVRSHSVRRIPTLALAGELDLRTPVADARAIARTFEPGSVMVVPRVGHGVLARDEDGRFRCADAVGAWLKGRSRGNLRCRAQQVPSLFSPLPATARSVRDVPALPGLPPHVGRTLRAVARTLREADVVLASWGGAPGGKSTA